MKRLTLRIPGNVYERVAKLADEEYRSVNAQVVYMLQEKAEREEAEKEDRATEKIATR